jgi:hypothetical protein
MTRWLLATSALLAALAPAPAADLSKVDRTIRGEPRYAGRPRYCLVVFGPGARDRIWLVRDGDTLYADKDGNGRLTDPGEQVAAQKDGQDLTFPVGTVRVGGREHRNLTVRASRLSGWGDAVTAHPASQAALKKDRDADLMNVSAEVEVPGLRGGGDDGRLQVGARIDAGGPLVFGDTPADAPVLHFGGPLHLRAEEARPTLYRNVVHDLMLVVGTPGVGPGTFAMVGYDGLIPPGAFAVVEAEYPPAKPGDPPVRQRYELRERC